MQKYVLHTKSRLDREALFTQELKFQNCIDYQVIEGTIDPHGSIAGISDSHKKIVELAKANNLPQVLIMENDVKFTSSKSLDRFIELTKDLPDDWDIFLAGCSSGTITKITPFISRIDKYTGFFCYIVRDKFYDTFLKAHPSRNIDNWVATQGHAVTYCAQPMLAITHPGYSDNVKKYVEYSKYFQKYLLWYPDF